MEKVTITEIRKLKRLYKVVFDEAFSLEAVKEGEPTDTLYVCEDTVVQFLLSKDKRFSVAELAKMMTYDAYAQGRALGLYYLSFKPRTTKEVEKYLLEHEISPEQTEKVLEGLLDDALLDDRSYTETFVAERIAMATGGPLQIKQKLYDHGIDGDLAEEVIGQIFDEASQVQVAAKLAEKLVRAQASRHTLRFLRQKVIQNLMSKGFSFSIAQATLDALDIEQDDENERELLMREVDKAYRKYSRSYEGYDLKNRITQAVARKGFDFSAISDALGEFEL